MSVCMYVCKYVCMYVIIYIYTYTCAWESAGCPPKPLFVGQLVVHLIVSWLSTSISHYKNRGLGGWRP